MSTATAAFSGFRPEAIQFMVDLAQHNERDWFQPRKADYERLVKEPFEALVADLADRFASRGVPLQADPKRSVFRIYRDTRFSKDKSPYKRHLGASFPWIEGLDPDSPGEMAHGNGAYFNFEPGQMYVGGGMWQPDKSRLDAFRSNVIKDPGRVRAAFEDPGFLDEFPDGVTSHETFKRLPAGLPPDHELADWLRYKDMVFGHRLSDADVESAALPDLLTDAFAAAVPVFRFLATLDD
jgi:uncharacterized protein (TIGR02453 family)